MLGLDQPIVLGHFVAVRVGDELTLDFADADRGADIAAQHYAFLVSETAFDEIFDRIKARSIAYWADPSRKRLGEPNRWDGGRGVYFDDPDGHLLEVLTRPYGSAGTATDYPHPLIAPTLAQRGDDDRDQPRSSGGRLAQQEARD
jgi:hypothetical protein